MKGEKMKEIEQLYHQYKNDLYFYLYSLTKDASWSEDLLMDTFLQAMGSLTHFKNQSSIKTWLFGIARNCWLQSLRKRKDFVEYNDLQMTVLQIQLDQKKQSKEKLTRCMELLKAMNLREQQIFTLLLDGYSYAEISLRMCLAEGSCRVLAHRTRNKIKEQLKKEGYND